MGRSFLISAGGLIIGLGIGYLLVLHPIFSFFNPSGNFEMTSPLSQAKHQVIGFLPYWLLKNSANDYSQYINRVAYFALTLGSDGRIKKLDNPIEEEPGWYSLTSGKADVKLKKAREKHQTLSLVIFSGDNETIAEMLTDPVTNARHLMGDVIPLMRKYGFSDLNLDIEQIADATDVDRSNFILFASEIKHILNAQKAGTLTVDITGDDLIRNNLIEPEKIGKIADYVMLMMYDFHYTGSSVTGPVAPLSGAGTVAEYDIESAVQKALTAIPAEKIILGAPLYGYEWETLGDDPRSPVIPSSGIIASNKRVEDLLSNCASCSAKIDQVAKESYLIYKDQGTGTYHQIFYPTDKSMQVKIDFALRQDLAGIGLWALGYEGKTILGPLKEYK